MARVFLDGAGCQPVRLGSLPRRLVSTAHRGAKTLPASCRQLQTGSLCSPETETRCFEFRFVLIRGSMTPRVSRKMRRPWYRPSLTVQIMIGLVVGGLIGWLRPDWGNAVYFLRDIFINLIKSIIAPLVFSTIVVGIAGAGALRKVGRMGVKALIYFEIVTTAALFIGLAVVNFMKPGAGITLAASNTDIIKTIGQSHPKTLVETLVHVFPSSVIDSMVRGDVLQIVAFSVLFALAISSVGEKGKPIIRAMESLSQIMFKFTNYVMMFAPIGVGAAMAHTVATQGLGVLANLGKLIGSLYLALIIFVAVVFGLVMLIARIPVRQYIRAVREPATIAFATTSSESALPKAMEAMERFGVPRHIVGFVMPTGYSFNLDGSTLYLAMASVFVAQAAETAMGWHMGLACVNVIGNCLATVVVARWEKEFDENRARVFGTAREAELDLKSGDVAFADAVHQGD